MPAPVWTTIHSGLSKGLVRPIDLDADGWSPVRRWRQGPPDEEERIP